ncbi:MAG TPA: MBL fold metallo-hydrolase RNA specificity domain-containing protein, partial [Kiritimatiellia bacterium]|nr:MBL fold metallo-hydrolase RNA specificity domain-containing protein [Kiritimatiellia bacterium]
YRLGPAAFPTVKGKIPGTLPRPSILVTTSGMMDEAFSASLLDQLLPRETTRVLLVGWADPRTPAGQLAAGKKTVTRQSRRDSKPGEAQSVEVRASVSQYRVFSAHTDLADTLRWLSCQDRLTPISLVHGEAAQLASRHAALIAAGFLHVDIEHVAGEGSRNLSGGQRPESQWEETGHPASGSPPGGAPATALSSGRTGDAMIQSEGLQVLTLVAVVEGPVTSKKGNVRLTCRLDSGDKVVFWGTAGSDTRNIDRIRQARFPVRVRCQCVPPSADAARFGHRWWIPESSPLEILP